MSDDSEKTQTSEGDSAGDTIMNSNKSKFNWLTHCSESAAARLDGLVIE